MTITEIVNELLTCDEINFAELFVTYWKAVNAGMRTCDELVSADDVTLYADDMNNFDLDGFIKYMKNVLGEIIFSEEIESSAWWKEEQK